MGVKEYMEQIRNEFCQFMLLEEMVLHVIELVDQREAQTDPEERASASENLRFFLLRLSDHELHELMCLMDFGRNLSWYGFTRDVAESFIEQVKTDHFNHINGMAGVKYLAGKTPLGKWLRLAGKQIRSGMISDDFFRIIYNMPNEEGIEHTENYEEEDAAWAKFKELATKESAEKYSSAHLIRYSYTGRAETRIASIAFG